MSAELQERQGHRSFGPWRLILTAICIAYGTAVTALQLSSCCLTIEVFQIDSLFVLDVVERLNRGDIPYVDFPFHLGALPFQMVAGADPENMARSFILGQLIFTFACVLVAMWIWWRRLNWHAGLALVFFVFVMSSALSTPLSGEVSIALFYNRWAWSLGIIFCVLCFAPTKPGEIDAVLTGLLAFALLMTKVTFFVGIALPALVIALFQGRTREVIIGCVVCLLCMALVSLAYGTEYWIGYAQDLNQMRDNPIRPAPGYVFPYLLVGPEFLPYSACALAFLFMVLHDHGRNSAILHGSVFGGLLYVQYQNFGNVPFWIICIAILSLSFAPHSSTVRDRRIWTLLGSAFLVVSCFVTAPLLPGSLINSRAERDQSAPLLPLPQMEDVRFPGVAETKLDPENCQAFAALIATADVMRDLGGPSFVVDGPTPYWMLAGTPPLPASAPWNYAGTNGIAHADHVIVPTCPLRPPYVQYTLEALDDAGIELREMQRNAAAVVYEIAR